MRFRLAMASGLVIAELFGAVVSAQAQQCYVLVPKTVYEDRPVIRTKWVAETTYEQKEVSQSVPVVTTETRERRTIAFRPVVKNKILEERFDVYKPVIETSDQEQMVTETSYETVTEVQKQQVLVEKPIRETRYRDETVLVKKPVNQTVYQAENVTTYRPETRLQTEYTTAYMPGLNSGVSPPGVNRLQWLSRGYYWDSATNGWVFRRPGFHWVNEGVTPTTNQAVLVPRQSAETVLVPEVTQHLKPVTVSGYEETYETRRVPYTVETIQQVYETREVPVSVQKPVTKVRSQKIPQTTTRFEKQEVVRRTPFQESVCEKVEAVEPYQVQVQKYVTETKLVTVPKTAYRQVQYQATERVAKTVWEKVAVDQFGNPVVTFPDYAITSSLTRSIPLATSSSSTTTSTARPTFPAEAKGFEGQLQSRGNLQGETAILKDRKIIDADSVTEAQETSVLDRGGADQSTDNEKLESRKLKPILKRPNQVEADIPPSLDRPPMPDETKNEPAGEAPATKTPNDPPINE